MWVSQPLVNYSNSHITLWLSLSGCWEQLLWAQQLSKVEVQVMLGVLSGKRKASGRIRSEVVLSCTGARVARSFVPLLLRADACCATGWVTRVLWFPFSCCGDSFSCEICGPPFLLQVEHVDVRTCCGSCGQQTSGIPKS